VTDQARSTIRGKVKIDVRASVDPAGRVTNAAVESQNSRYFANLTVKAVEQWSFEPREAASEWLLQFELTPSGTTVHPSRVSH
jgi:TonB family protein